MKSLRKAHHKTRIAVLVAALVASALAAPSALTQTGKKPISRKGLVDAVKINGLSTAELVQHIQRRGVDFEMTADAEQELRSVGAQPAIIDAARSNFRQPVVVAAPPTAPPSSSSTRPTGPPVPPGPPLSKNEVVTMLQAGSPSARVEQFVEARGVTFQITPDITSEIKAAGGDRSLIGAITEKSTTPVPASTPGHAGEVANSGPDYDDFIDRVQSSVSYNDWSTAINLSRQAIQLDPSKPEGYSFLGQAMLYGRSDLAAAEQAMRKAIEAGGSARFKAYHSCQGDFARVCVGSFFVTKDGVSFRADDGVDTFETSDSNIKEAKTNGWVGVEYGAFHVKPREKVIGRDNFNFAPFSRSRAESHLIIKLIQGYQ